MKIRVITGGFPSERLTVARFHDTLEKSQELFGRKEYGAFFMGKFLTSESTISELLKTLHFKYSSISSNTLFLPEGCGWIFRYYAVGKEISALFVPISKALTSGLVEEIPMVHLPELTTTAIPTQQLIEYFEENFEEFQV